MTDVWYAQERIKIPGIIRYREAVSPLTGKARKVRTLLSDLTLPEEEIVSAFTKNCRYEIRRAGRENVEVCRYLGKDITQEVCDRFVRYYDEFWKSKGNREIECGKTAQEILKYAEEGRFAITEARIGDNTVVYHTYVVGDTIVRLYQSASHYRTEEAVTQQAVGMANRYLHKEDMMWFRKLGKQTYDWGGAGEQEEVASITRFKEAFGGKEAFFYEDEEVNGVRAKTYRALIRILNALGA